MAAIAGLKHDDRDHQRGGEAGGEGGGICIGHLFGSCLGGGGPSPALTRRPMCLTGSAITLAFEHGRIREGGTLA